MSDTHAAFLKVPPDRQWTRGLQPLFNHLVASARGHKLTHDERKADLFPSWVMLRGGVIVAMRELRESNGCRFELRFARAENLENEQKWEVELAVFLRSFEIRVVDGGTPCKIPGNEWIRGKPGPKDHGRTAARFISLLLGEIQPGKAQCYQCFEEDETTTLVDWFAPGGIQGQRCRAHATKQTRAEAQGRLL